MSTQKTYRNTSNERTSLVFIRAADIGRGRPVKVMEVQIGPAGSESEQVTVDLGEGVVLETPESYAAIGITEVVEGG